MKFIPQLMFFFFSLLEQKKKINFQSNRLFKTCSKIILKSAMLLPSCAFVLRNVHLCQSFPRQSHTSAHRSALSRFVCRIRVLQAVTDTSTISVTPLSPLFAQRDILSLGLLQHICLLQDELYRLNAVVFGASGHKNDKQHHRNWCVKASSSWIVFLMIECCDSKTNSASVFCRNLFCCFYYDNIYILYILCIFCNFVTWCILYFLCYNWYFVLCFVWLVRDTLT